ncbi:N-6 DNA methylase [uncultured Deinococcus sp.]|uniref:Eco57I restriction-modification methylase domain-containing protein n=1 Tax=uncultured Deinococcus sp. TaxID=158789 RepID=UPI0025E2E14C|nr:N-6 DNA methylase [uncultured Deinococcus sp.]
MKGSYQADIFEKDLLSISYNNLTDWHIQIYSDIIRVYFNRTSPPTLVESIEVTDLGIDRLHRRNFEIITNKRPSPNIPSLDVALIKTISEGKATIHSSLLSKGITVGNEEISALFNALIVIRAIEDYANSSVETDLRYIDDSLLADWQTKSNIDIQTIISEYIAEHDLKIPSYLVNTAEISIFSHLERYIITDIIRGLYRGRYYGYDFSVISKHSLSKIYEHYMSVLYYRESDQPYLLLEARRPEEKFEKIYGSIYTPQYIAKFFAQISLNILGSFRYLNAKSLDPACGSGIFLRNIAEHQLELAYNSNQTYSVIDIVNNIHGIDKNPNASYASKLSMALLSYSISGSFPEELGIETAESLNYMRGNQIISKYDIVIANPPYISVERQEAAVREAVLDTLGELAHGRVDTYLGFIKSSIDAVKSGGVVMLVIPQSFMNSASGKTVRGYISENTTVRYICDLSEVDVFPGTGAYVILLVLEKRISSTPAIAMRALSSIGEALENVVNGELVNNSNYSIFTIDQERFKESNWIISRREEFNSLQLPSTKLGDFAEIRQGFISGNDDVFIRDKASIPEAERKVWVDYLSDREMDTYTITSDSKKVFFMPYIDGKKIRDFAYIEANFPHTAQILKNSETNLTARTYLSRYHKLWWEPTWPRTPDTMLIPKIVTPQIVIYPRFSLDSNGEFSVSHSPFIVPKKDNGDEDLLYLLLPILNSTLFFWLATNNSPKYRGGYYRFSSKVLLSTPIPDITQIPQTTKRKVISLVKSLLNEKNDAKSLLSQQELDDLVFEFYAIDKADFLRKIQ